METQTFAAFAGPRCIANGSLADVLPVLKQRFDRDTSDMVLVFDLESGRQLDFDLRGSLEEVMARAQPGEGPRGPGRPKLGVTSREVSLLPRHWDWLEQQSTGPSGALRRLIEHAMKNQSGKDRAAHIRAALSKVLSTMAGNRPHFEEASRALFAGETKKFESLVEQWPKDIRELAVERARAAARAEKEA